MTKDLSVLVKGDLLINSQQPEKDVLELLLRFTTITAWKLFEGDAKYQLYLVQYVTNRLKTEYKNVTLQMFETAIVEKHKEAFERSAAALFDLLDYWLVDYSEKLKEARQSVRVEKAPQLAARTESQLKQDAIDLFVTLYHAHKNNDRIVGGWSTPYRILKEKAIHVPDAEINKEIWAQVRAVKKQAFTEALKSPYENERNESRQALENWDRWMENNVNLLLADYEQAICRHYFDLLGDGLLERINQ